MEHVHLKTGWKTVLALLASLFFVLDISAQEITVQGTVKIRMANRLLEQMSS